MAYLLLENGDRLQLEDGSGDLLLEEDEAIGFIFAAMLGNNVHCKIGGVLAHTEIGCEKAHATARQEI